MKNTFLILSVTIASLFGGHEFDKVGSTSAQFLKLGVGARSMEWEAVLSD